MDKKKFLFGTSCAFIVGAIVTTLALGLNPKLPYLNVTAISTSRVVTFDGTHTNITTSAGNNFWGYWINKCNNSSSGGGYLAFLDGKISRSTPSGSFYYNLASYGIKGDYNISNVSQIDIVYQVPTTYTSLVLYSIDEEGNTLKSWNIQTNEGTYSQSEFYTETLTFNGDNSFYGFIFKANSLHSVTSGHSTAMVRAYIKSFKITYFC